MEIERSPLDGVVVISPRVFSDDRGYFFENFKESEWKKQVDNFVAVQQNVSVSKKNVIRGLHYQKGEYSQGKIVSVLCGKILDVAVDIRKGSPTFGKYFSIELSDENHKLLYIPKGFAHGFLALSDKAVVSYLTDESYNHESEMGIRFDDSDIGIDWEISLDDAIVLDRDKEFRFLKDIAREDLF